jgi:hypothetical protein
MNRFEQNKTGKQDKTDKGDLSLSTPSILETHNTAHTYKSGGIPSSTGYCYSHSKIMSD